MRKSLTFFTVILACAVMFTGCLTCEKKDYVYTLNKDGSVNLTITFFNIMSSYSPSEDDESITPASTIESDYGDLITNYVEGSQPENEYNNAIVESKRLYEENGKLNGEVKLKFMNLADAGLFASKKHKLIIKDFCSSFSETLSSTNGQFNQVNPFIIWDIKSSKLTYTTSVSSPTEENMNSLLPRWKNQ